MKILTTWLIYEHSLKRDHFEPALPVTSHTLLSSVWFTCLVGSIYDGLPK